MNSPKVENKRYELRNHRIAIIGVFITVLYAIVGLKVIYLQVVKDDFLSETASSQYSQCIQGRGKRGAILDAKNRELAINTETVEIGVHPQKIRRIEKQNEIMLGDKEKQDLAKVVAGILKMDSESVYQIFSLKKEFKFLNRMVSPAVAHALKVELQSRKIFGFEFDSAFCRAYPNKTLAAQVVGFTSVDGQGIEGLEKYFDKDLQGDPKQWTIIKDRMGRVFDTREVAAPGYEGDNLILTIDSTIQYIAEEALGKSVTENNAKSGIAIVMVPKTGAIKAIAHYPTFNLNSFGSFPESVWRNRAIADTFEPGSTMKVFTMAAAIESGLVTPEKMFFCENGRYRVGRNTIGDTHKYGYLTVHDILKVSSNIGSVKIGEVIGPECLYSSLKSFGFGDKTGIDCPGEAKGLFRHYKLWKPIDQATVAFGQGLTVTPIQLVTAISAIANQGILMTPYLVDAVTDEAGNIIKRFEPVQKRRTISASTAQTLMQMMSAATAPGGTGTKAVPVGYTVCGKTGTAQKLNADGTYRNCEYNGVFVGFSPMENPELAILVVIDSPQKHHYGGLVAAPVFREIAEETFNYMNVPPAIPDEDELNKEQLNVSIGAGERGA
ncbi:MAG: penicillin-binding protein 2 [Desulfobacteraceae bacterium]|nr:MAG: penicillin-binding protein 2 [Desulfobacteraceae bacterium]